MKYICIGITFFVGASSLIAQTNPKRGWSQFGGSPTHTCAALAPSQNLVRVKWQAPLDMQPHISGGGTLLCHYGTPLITPRNTIVLPVKVHEFNDFRFEGRRAGTGARIWIQRTDYVVPDSGWTPGCSGALLPNGDLVMPGGGGTLLIRDNPDAAQGHVRRIAFYGLAAYNANPATYNATVKICTPLTTDDDGNIFFGFMTESGAPGGLVGGFARIGADGSATWISAAAASVDPTIVKPTYNCAPAVGPNGVVYVSVNRGGFNDGYLLGLNKNTLAPMYKGNPHDPRNGNPAIHIDLGTASPMIGTDGDVYMGVFENPYNGSRGWLAHFNSTLTVEKPFGAFGWDNSPSLIPSDRVPQYTGSSPYLLFCKYNFYGAGGNVDQMAILDPNATQIEPLTGATVMKEVIKVNAPFVTEWCINSAAVDLTNRCVTAGNEDGYVHRWDWATNTITQSKSITAGIGEAYTPIFSGYDGTIFAVNHATLFAVGN